MTPKSVAVTGADGFVGLHLCRMLDATGRSVVRIVRKAAGPGGVRRVVPDLRCAQDLHLVLENVSCIIHLAGRAHVLREVESDSLKAFREVNVHGTARLAEAAARARVAHFVFVSSIGVNGSETFARAFTEADDPAPIEPYAQSKLEAEQWLEPFCAAAGVRLTIVRPPMVYGPGAAGNFHRLLRLAASGIPLPIGAIRNRRNLIGVQNLCDFLLLCLTHPAASGTFLVAEPEARSTPELVVALADALGVPSRVFAAPLGLLRTCAAIVGRQQELAKLCGSLEISADKARRLLEWHPPASFTHEIARVASAYRTGRLL